ncbi:LuxR C-terminal-related transcriptional regulator [Aquitalea sp. USM4]|uniref:helix-turn-helix transcriptional regulator n=1 Tax=Aquitalea sp. USM4 TaxID=1590041 RepID=UPI00103DB0E1|nr:LuxR C-terminal-related transcriptional regulator [Aquitalea sp. USM4]QBJ77865.1 hypothetical protein DKK66_06980 [Aquitalea sp. USM4]
MTSNVAVYHNLVRLLTAPPPQPAQFPLWLEQSLLPLFQCDRAFCVRGEVIAGQVKATHWLPIGYSAVDITSFLMQFEWKDRGCLRWWLQNRQPFLLNRQNPSSFATLQELQEMERVGLKGIIGHGLVSHLAKEGTYFSFGQTANSLGIELLPIMQLIMPLLHSCFTDYIHKDQQEHLDFSHIPPRKRLILRYLLAGCYDKEIAEKMNISEKTVRNQLSEIYHQFGVGSRSQLLVKLK